MCRTTLYDQLLADPIISYYTMCLYVVPQSNHTVNVYIYDIGQSSNSQKFHFTVSSKRNATLSSGVFVTSICVQRPHGVKKLALVHFLAISGRFNFSFEIIEMPAMPFRKLPMLKHFAFIGSLNPN